MTELFRPTSPCEREAYRAFRWRMLRQPWNQAADPPDSRQEQQSEHVALRCASGEIIGCGRVRLIAPGQAQIQAMAVAPQVQRRGLGQRMLRYLEQRACGRGAERCVIHARASALDFYIKAGYAISGPGTTLFGEIPHLWLEKKFALDDFSAYGLTRRAARDQDAARVSELVFSTLAEYGLSPELQGIDQDLHRLEMSYREGFFDLLLNAQEQLVGTLAILRISPSCGELRRMYLAPQVRGQGLGRACLGRALSWARRTGLEQLELETASVLQQALGLYRWAGFTPIEGTCITSRCDQRLGLDLQAQGALLEGRHPPETPQPNRAQS